MISNEQVATSLMKCLYGAPSAVKPNVMLMMIYNCRATLDVFPSFLLHYTGNNILLSDKLIRCGGDTLCVTIHAAAAFDILCGTSSGAWLQGPYTMYHTVSNRRMYRSKARAEKLKLSDRNLSQMVVKLDSRVR